MNFAAQKTIYDSDILAIEPEMPGSFYLKGSTTPLAGSLTVINNTVGGDDFGYIQGFDYFLLVRASVFPTGVIVSKVNDLIDVIDPLGNRIPCSIKSREISQDGVSITYGLKSST